MYSKDICCSKHSHEIQLNDCMLCFLFILEWLNTNLNLLFVIKNHHDKTKLCKQQMITFAYILLRY